MNYASAIIRDGQVVGGMLANPEHPGHAPALTDAVKAELQQAIDLLPKDGQNHLVELYQPEHHDCQRGNIKAGLHVNGVHAHPETHTETTTTTVTTLEIDATP